MRRVKGTKNETWTPVTPTKGPEDQVPVLVLTPFMEGLVLVFTPFME